MKRIPSADSLDSPRVILSVHHTTTVTVTNRMACMSLAKLIIGFEISYLYSAWLRLIGPGWSTMQLKLTNVFFSLHGCY